MLWLVSISIVVLYLWSTINILKEYEHGVVFPVPIDILKNWMQSST